MAGSGAGVAATPGSAAGQELCLTCSQPYRHRTGVSELAEHAARRIAYAVSVSGFEDMFCATNVMAF